MPSIYKIHLNDEMELDLPPIIDRENNPISLIQTLPGFVKFANNKYYLSPINPSLHLGVFTIKAYMTDSQFMTPFKFQI